MVDIRALPQNQLDLAARGGIEAGTEGHETLDDGGVRVRLDGVVDVRAALSGAKAGGQGVELTLDGVDIDDQGRMREIVGLDKGLDSRGCKGRRAAEAGYCVHGHLH